MGKSDNAVTITLSTAQVEAVLLALSHFPMREVFDLYLSIRTQSGAPDSTDVQF